MASEDLRNVEIVIRGCPFSVDVSISNVAEGAREGLFTTVKSRTPEFTGSRLDVAESDIRSRDFKPSTGGIASWIEGVKSSVPFLVLEGDLKDKDRRGGELVRGADNEAGKTGTAGTGGGGALDLDNDNRRDARRNEKLRCGAVPSTVAELAAIVLDDGKALTTTLRSYL